MQNVITEPDYANKVDLKSYASADNCYEVTQKGFVLVFAGHLAYGVSLIIYDASGTADVVPLIPNALYATTAVSGECEACTLPVSIGMQLYVTGGNAGSVWFVPYK